MYFPGFWLSDGPLSDAYRNEGFLILSLSLQDVGHGTVCDALSGTFVDIIIQQKQTDSKNMAELTLLDWTLGQYRLN